MIVPFNIQLKKAMFYGCHNLKWGCLRVLNELKALQLAKHLSDMGVPFDELNTKFHSNSMALSFMAHYQVSLKYSGPNSLNKLNIPDLYSSWFHATTLVT